MKVYRIGQAESVLAKVLLRCGVCESSVTAGNGVRVFAHVTSRVLLHRPDGRISHL